MPLDETSVIEKIREDDPSFPHYCSDRLNASRHQNVFRWIDIAPWVTRFISPPEAMIPGNIQNLVIHRAKLMEKNVEMCRGIRRRHAVSYFRFKWIAKHAEYL